MKKAMLALAAVACVAAASAVVPAPALAQDFSVRIGSGPDYGYRDDWRARHAYGYGDDWSWRRHHRPYFAFARPNCRTVIRERHGPIVIRRVINRCY